MPNHVSHFNIEADDLARAKRFYERVFGWQLRAWGPPDFFMIQTGTDADPGIHGSLSRRDEPLPREGMNGFECTISVDDIDVTAAAIEQHGGRIVLPKSVIHGVGTHIRFLDSEGNIVAAMQYDTAV